MKTFKKVLASALAAAMVVTAFPVANAEAATAPKLSATKATIYAGQSKTITVKNLTGTWKGAKVVSASSKKSVATVARKGSKITVKAVKAGTATVTVKVTPKKGAAKKLTAKITVKNPSVAFTDSVSEVAVGATETLTATSTPKAAVKFYSADKTIATVGKTTGVVTGVKEGTVKIAAKFYTGKKENKVYKEITVKKQIFKDVKQTKADTLEAVIAGDTKSLKADDVKITNTKTNVVYAVKSVTVDKTDATKVTIVTFAKMNDGNDYSVVIADTTKTVTATDGKIAAVVVKTTTIPYATLSTISAVATDASNIELAELNPTTTTVDGKTVTFTVTPAAGGYTTGAQLYLAKKGDVAKAKVTIKSGDYDNTGKEINNIESVETEITAGDQETVSVADFKARVSTESSKSYDEVKENASLAIGENGYAYFKFTNSKNEDATYANYKVASSNTNVLVLSEQDLFAATGKKGSTAVAVYGVATGSAYIIVKDKTNKDAIVATIPVTVNAARTVDTFSLDRNSFVLSTSTSVGSEAVNLTVKDQYGDKVTSGYNVECAVLASPSGATTAMAPQVTTSAAAVTFAAPASNAKTGTYTYKITVKAGTVERSQVVTVDFKAPTGAVAYAFELTGVDASNTVDATLNDKFASAKNVLIKVVETKGGVKSDYVNLDSNITVKKDNKDCAEYTVASNTKTATFAAISTGAAGTTTPVTAAAAGTYVVSGKVSVSGTVYNVATATFVVKNDTAKVTVAQANNEVLATDLSGGAELEKLVKKAFTFKFGSTDLKFDGGTSNVSYVTAETTPASPAYTANNVVFVKNVTLNVTFATGYTTTVKVDVNKSVTIK